MEIKYKKVKMEHGSNVNLLKFLFINKIKNLYALKLEQFNAKLN